MDRREKIKALILEHKITLPKDREFLTIEGFDKAVILRAGEIADQIAEEAEIREQAAYQQGWESAIKWADKRRLEG